MRTITPRDGVEIVYKDWRGGACRSLHRGQELGVSLDQRSRCLQFVRHQTEARLAVLLQVPLVDQSLADKLTFVTLCVCHTRSVTLRRMYFG